MLFQSLYHFIRHKALGIADDGIKRKMGQRKKENQVQVIGHDDISGYLYVFGFFQIAKPFINQIVSMR